MGFFRNSKVQKSISVLLASLSVGGLGGCKKTEKKEVDEIPNERVEETLENNYEEKYDKALEELGVKVETETEEKVQEENEFKKVVNGMTERDRLESVLLQKGWGETEEALILEMYDTVERNYDFRDIYNPKDKQVYLRNLVNTINSVNEIKIDYNDDILAQNGWNARADYSNNKIVLKFENANDLRHELAHMEDGTFLVGSIGVDLGFVYEEGRASAKEGDATKDTKWIDNIPINVNTGSNKELIINDCSGSYPAFEEVYKHSIKLRVDLEKIRKEKQPLDVYRKQIENQLNQLYGNELGTQYIESVNAYIEFFDKDGQVVLEQNQLGQDVFEVRQDMLSVYEKCIAQNRNKQENRVVGMVR